MKRAWVVAAAAMILPALFALSGSATDAQMVFSSDKNGQNRVTNIQEGDSIWIVVIDNDQNIDCDIRDKFTTDVKLMDPKTGAYILWDQDPAFGPGHLVGDYLEETGPDTGVFVSNRTFRIGTRESFSLAEPWKHTHVVDRPASPLRNFIWGNYAYLGNLAEGGGLYTKYGFTVTGDQAWWVGHVSNNSLAYEDGLIDLSNTAFILPSELDGARSGGSPNRWLVGRFENMDTLVGMIQDPNDPTDIAIALMKIIDTEATIAWDAEIYKDANESATLTIVDPDENLSCAYVEYVPVFILVNPGSWNPANSSLVDTDQTGDSPNNFCMLKRTGGIAGDNTADLSVPSILDVDDPGILGDGIRPIRWYNIYNAERNDQGYLGAADGRYYVQYPKDDVFGPQVGVYASLFDTVSDNGVTAVSFYAMETGPDTGVFQLNLNSILVDLGFNSLNVRDVLVAYYLDPNDDDDFKLATAVIEEQRQSLTSFTDVARTGQTVYWIGRDPVYIQVIDANANVDPCCPEQVVVHICDPHDEDDGEFWVLDEVSSNSPVFFSHQGMELLAVWDSMGVGSPDRVGGFQLILDNWRLEVFNEDDVYVRYNDVTYVNNIQGMLGLGDVDTVTAYSGPRIDRVRVSNDVSFDWMSIADTQVYDGEHANMWFLDRQGQRVSGYVTSDCVFVEVLDPDQNEAPYRRERIDGYWDGGQNWPFGPQPLNEFGCDWERTTLHPVNALLGDTNIFNDSPVPVDGNGYARADGGAPKLYVLNPRSGRWAAIDLLETGGGTGDFVSVTCIELTNVYACVPTLDVLPGDTIVAVYQDPSNHSDSAWISIKVGIGGGGTPPSRQSTTMFVDASGNEVANYTDADMVYVKVIDPSHAGTAVLPGALEINGETYDLTIWYDVQTFAVTDTFMTDALDLDLTAGQAITATYTDPTDLMDTSADTITVIASVLVIDSFYAGPNPFDAEVTFGFNGTGVAATLSVAVYSLAGGLVWETTDTDVSEIVWDAAGLANGGYIYVITATDGTNTFDGNGKVFVNR